MTKPVFSIPFQLNVKYVPRLMNNYNVRIAPVEENGEFIGLIDFSQCLYDSLEN
jgi:predicted transcriptional regulator